MAAAFEIGAVGGESLGSETIRANLQRMRTAAANNARRRPVIQEVINTHACSLWRKKPGLRGKETANGD